MNQEELFWVDHESLVWIPSKLKQRGDKFLAKSIDGEELELSEAQFAAAKASPVHVSSLQAVENMISLDDLSESVILQTLRDRYKRSLIYTYISSILVSVNPYKRFNMYGEDAMRTIRCKDSPKRRVLRSPQRNLNSSSGPGTGSTAQPILSATSPHIYLLAAEAHKALLSSGKDQSVIISGESGAGKTEATKYILKYLSYLSSKSSAAPSALQRRKSSGEPKPPGGPSVDTGVDRGDGAPVGVEELLVQANPVVEAFGNAKTVRNDNSSRFGKWIEVQLDSQHCVSGGKITHYLLEKTRVVTQAPHERNYHIMYQVCAARGHQALQRFKLGAAEEYAYLMNVGTDADANQSLTQEFEDLLGHMKSLGFSQKDVSEVLSATVAVLRLGNVPISPGPNGNEEIASIDETDASLTAAAAALGVEPAALAVALTQSTKSFGRDVIKVPLKLGQALSNRDALAKQLYGKLFDWLIHKINAKLDANRQSNKYVFGKIGVLDIFGFEIFEVNRLEQFLINFANEKLQNHFNHFVFTLEQEEYAAEGLDLPRVDFIDNSFCLQLIEQPRAGLVAELDEEVRLPKGSDANFLERVTGRHVLPSSSAPSASSASSFFIKPRVRSQSFGVRHYAGEVMYEVEGFLEKNRDRLQPQTVTFLQGSSKSFLAALFVEDEETAAGKCNRSAPSTPSTPASSGGGGVRRQMKNSPFTGVGSPNKTPGKRGPGKGGKGGGSLTLCGRFRTQLHSLMDTLHSTQPHFVRCIKPNSAKAANNFDSQLVLRQLRYAGLKAVVQVRKSGYPYRMAHRQFFNRFRLLLTGAQLSQVDAQRITALQGGQPPAEVVDGDEEDVQGPPPPWGKACVRLLELLELADRYGLGKTKLFLADNTHKELERRRGVRLTSLAVSLQSARRGAVARRSYRLRVEARDCVREVLAASKNLPLPELLHPSFAQAAKDSLRDWALQRVPMWLGEVAEAEALLVALAAKEEARAALAAAARVLPNDKEDGDAVYADAMEAADALGAGMEGLPEYVVCKGHRREASRLLKERLAREEEERRAKEEAARRDKERKERLEREAKEREDRIRMAAEEERKELERIALEEAQRLKEQEEREAEEAKNIELQKMRLAEARQKLEEERREMEEEKRRWKARERQQEEASRLGFETSKAKRKKEEDQRLRKRTLSGELSVGQEGSDIETWLRARIAELEQEKKDMSQEHLWFKETHQQTKDDLWERLAQAETEKKTYKKRVKDMEEKYLSDLEAFKETNSSLALKVEAAFNGSADEVSELQRRNADKIDELEKRHANEIDGYLHKIVELEEVKEQYEGDLMQKCAQNTNMSQENFELVDKIDKQKRDLYSLRQQLADRTEYCTTLETRVAAQIREIKQLKRRGAYPQ